MHDWRGKYTITRAACSGDSACTKSQLAALILAGGSRWRPRWPKGCIPDEVKKIADFTKLSITGMFAAGLDGEATSQERQAADCGADYS